jgi:hypothetical protein
MMGRQDEPARLFYRFNLDRHVPADHVLRRIDAVLDLSAIRSALAPYYAATGRPSVDPVELKLELTRFRRHPEAFTRGVLYAQDASALFAEFRRQMVDCCRGRLLPSRSACWAGASATTCWWVLGSHLWRSAALSPHQAPMSAASD